MDRLQHQFQALLMARYNRSIRRVEKLRDALVEAQLEFDEIRAIVLPNWRYKDGLSPAWHRAFDEWKRDRDRPLIRELDEAKRIGKLGE